MTEMMSVACKLPSGLVLEIDELHKTNPPSEPQAAQPTSGARRKVALTGSQANNPRSPSPGRVVAGYGLTEVPKDFWDEWVKQHKGFPWLTNGTIFAQPSPDRATSQAKEQTKLRTSLEQLDPGKPGPNLAPENGKVI